MSQEGKPHNTNEGGEVDREYSPMLEEVPSQTGAAVALEEDIKKSASLGAKLLEKLKRTFATPADTRPPERREDITERHISAEQERRRRGF